MKVFTKILLVVLCVVPYGAGARDVVSRAARGSASGVGRSVAGGGNSARVASMGYGVDGGNSANMARVATTPGVNSGRGVAATNRRINQGGKVISEAYHWNAIGYQIYRENKIA